MKRLLFVALFVSAGLAFGADDLADANRLLAAQSYDKALPLYRKLAEAGNPEAQLRLGEMYWFGDGTAPDLAKARQWFERAAAAGNADAAASLAGLKRRETRADEIVYWTSSYQGEDLQSGRFACKRPELPALSRTKSQIEATGRAIAEWHACYNGFVDNLNDALPPGKRIPAEVVDMMTPAEGRQAQMHLDGVYGKLMESARRDAADFALQEAAWRKATETYVQVEAQRNEARKDDIQREQQLRTTSSSARQDLTPQPQAQPQPAR